MIISGETIHQCITAGIIEVRRGFPEERLTADQLTIGPNSVDVTLGGSLISPEHQGILDPRDPDSVKYHEVSQVKTPNGMAFMVLPHIVYLGFAAERFTVTQPLPVMLDEPQPIGPVGLYKCNLAHLPVVQMLDGRSTVGRIGIAVHVTAGFGDVGFDGNFTLEIVNFNRVPVLLYPGMRIGQIAFHCVNHTTNPPREYRGAYKYDHIGRPVPPVLGPDRF